MKKALLPLMICALFLSASCSADVNREADSAAIEERLAQLDAYKQTYEDAEGTDSPLTSGGAVTAQAFRGIPFGSTMSQVKEAETLELTKAYNNALDFETVSVYSYPMLVTYWFDELGQMNYGLYSMTNSAYLPVLQNLKASLSADYGEPAEAGYYTDSTTLVSFASNEEAVAAIDASEAYYYAEYTDAEGLEVTLYAENAAQGYSFYIYYTSAAV